MKIELHPLDQTQDPGFYRYLFTALRSHCHAKDCSTLRPVPRMIQPRGHESAWIRYNGEAIFFDMSDHAQILDLPALEKTPVYFKANHHPGILKKVLSATQQEHLLKKIVPFTFFAGDLEKFIPGAFRQRLMNRRKPSYDLCHVVGVYTNPVRDGEASCFNDTNTSASPSDYHFWIRYHMQQAFIAAGINGYFRLVSRGNQAIEDGVVVKPNLNRRSFMKKIAASQVNCINTMPHALLPWKATETLALGRPLVLERTPLMTTPKPFALIPDVHFFELLPNLGSFHEEATLKDPASYRALQTPSLKHIQQRALWLAEQLKNEDKLKEMSHAAATFTKEALAPENVARYICHEIEARIA